MSNSTTQITVNVLQHENSAKPFDLAVQLIRRDFNPFFNTPVGDSIADLLLSFLTPKAALNTLDSVFNANTVAYLAANPTNSADIEDAAAAFILGGTLPSDVPDFLNTNTGSPSPSVFAVSAPPSDADLDNNLRVIFALPTVLPANLQKDVTMLLTTDVHKNFMERCSVPVSDFLLLNDVLSNATDSLNASSRIDKLIATTAPFDFSAGLAFEYLSKAKTWLADIKVEWDNTTTVKGDWYNLSQAINILGVGAVTIPAQVPAATISVDRKALSIANYVRLCALNYTTNSPTPPETSLSDQTYTSVPIDITKDLLNYSCDRDLILTYFKKVDTDTHKILASSDVTDSLFKQYLSQHYDSLDDMEIKAEFRAVVAVGAVKAAMRRDADFVKLVQIPTTVTGANLNEKIVNWIDAADLSDHAPAFVATGFGTYATPTSNPLTISTNPFATASSDTYENFITQNLTSVVVEKTPVPLPVAQLLLLAIMIITQRYAIGTSTLKSVSLIYDFCRLAFKLEEGIILRLDTQAITTAADLELLIFGMIIKAPTLAKLFREVVDRIIFKGIDYSKLNHIPLADNCEIQVDKNVKITLPFKGNVFVKNTSSAPILVSVLNHDGHAFVYENHKPVIVPARDGKKIYTQ